MLGRQERNGLAVTARHAHVTHCEPSIPVYIPVRYSDSESRSILRSCLLTSVQKEDRVRKAVHGGAVCSPLKFDLLKCTGIVEGVVLEVLEEVGGEVWIRRRLL